jgi:hypothetical protein
VGPQYGEIIADFVSNVFVNVLSAQESVQLRQPDYFGFGTQNVKNGPASATVLMFQYDLYRELCCAKAEARRREESHQDSVVNEAYVINVKIMYFSM